MRKIASVLLVLSFFVASCGSPTESPEATAFYSGAAAMCLRKYEKEICKREVLFMREHKFYEQYLELLKTTPVPKDPQG